MICILLVAGHTSCLEAEIEADPRGLYAHLEGVPKVTRPPPQGKDSIGILNFLFYPILTILFPYIL
jgi:hypothetical protein